MLKEKLVIIPVEQINKYPMLMEYLVCERWVDAVYKSVSGAYNPDNRNSPYQLAVRRAMEICAHVVHEAESNPRLSRGLTTRLNDLSRIGADIALKELSTEEGCLRLSRAISNANMGIPPTGRDPMVAILRRCVDISFMVNWIIDNLTGRQEHGDGIVYIPLMSYDRPEEYFDKCVTKLSGKVESDVGNYLHTLLGTDDPTIEDTFVSRIFAIEGGLSLDPGLSSAPARSFAEEYSGMSADVVLKPKAYNFLGSTKVNEVLLRALHTNGLTHRLSYFLDGIAKALYAPDIDITDESLNFALREVRVSGDSDTPECAEAIAALMTAKVAEVRKKYPMAPRSLPQLRSVTMVYKSKSKVVCNAILSRDGKYLIIEPSKTHGAYYILSSECASQEVIYLSEVDFKRRNHTPQGTAEIAAIINREDQESLVEMGE